jgi:hypothetical protein
VRGKIYDGLPTSATLRLARHATKIPGRPIHAMNAIAVYVKGSTYNDSYRRRECSKWVTWAQTSQRKIILAQIHGQVCLRKRGAWVILLLLSSRILKMLFLQITLMIEVRSVVLLLEHTKSDMVGELSSAPQKAWFSDRLARFIPITSVAFPPTALSLSYRSSG